MYVGGFLLLLFSARKVAEDCCRINENSRKLIFLRGNSVKAACVPLLATLLCSQKTIDPRKNHRAQQKRGIFSQQPLEQSQYKHNGVNMFLKSQVLLFLQFLTRYLPNFQSSNERKKFKNVACKSEFRLIKGGQTFIQSTLQVACRTVSKVRKK